MAVNTPLSFKDITIQMTIEHFIPYLRDSSKVLNGQHRYIIVASELMFPFINIITYHFRKSGEKNLASNNSNRLKNQFKSRVCCNVFHYHQPLFCRGTPDAQWRSREQRNDKEDLEEATFLFIFIFIFLFFFFFISVLEWLPFFRKRLHFLCSMLYYLFV